LHRHQQVRRGGDVARIGEAAGDAPDVVIQAEDLVDDDDTGRAPCHPPIAPRPMW
jgi:hypothetical protein